MTGDLVMADASIAVSSPPARVKGGGSECFGVIGVGVGDTGWQSLLSLVGALPRDSSLTLLVAPGGNRFHPSAAEQSALASASALPVCPVHDDLPLESGRVYLCASQPVTLLRQAGRLILHQESGEHASIDQLFLAIAEVCGASSVAVVLKGTGADGSLGLTAIKAAGGTTLAEPEAANNQGPSRWVDVLLDPSVLAIHLTDLASMEFAAVVPNEEIEAVRSEDFKRVLKAVRLVTGSDFSEYRASTLYRRVRRRMAIRAVRSLADYAGHLISHRAEAQALHRDILIGVTQFFRDPEAFEALKQTVLPNLFRNRSVKDLIRVWVVACATGEEVYSLVIALKEFAAQVGSSAPIIVYGTDLNDAAIEEARTGLYPRTIAQDVSPERLQRFFHEEDGKYRIGRTVRDCCIFSTHNVLSDPPFSKMDLVSCRNMLIYMQPDLQARLMPLLHYALKPDAWLFLGAAESTHAMRDGFEVEHATARIYRKKAIPVRALALPLRSPWSKLDGACGGRGTGIDDAVNELCRDAGRYLLRYAPPAVLVDTEMSVLQCHGDISAYLGPEDGASGSNLLHLASSELRVALKNALRRSLLEGIAIRADQVRVREDDEIALTVIPVLSGGARRAFWVVFEPGQGKPERRAELLGSVTPAPVPGDGSLAREQEELRRTRDHLQIAMEQYELASARLELLTASAQSAQEELQSVNEELQTSKEELQSSNEELITVNEELQTRNYELSQLNSDLQNLIGVAEVAMLMLSRDLRVRRHSSTAARLFNLINGDVGRPLTDIRSNIDVADLPTILRGVIDTGRSIERHARDRDGRWHLMRVRPYRTLAGAIDGVVIVLVDIDQMRRDQAEIARQATLLEHTSDAIFVRETSGAVLYWNHGAERLYGIRRQEIVGRPLREAISMDSAILAAAERELAARGEWSGELQQRGADGRPMVVLANQIAFEEEGRRLVLETHRDITERCRLEGDLQERVRQLALADRAKNDFLAMLAHELRNPLAPLRNAVRILKEVQHDESAAERTRQLIDRQVSHLVRLVDDLLEGARLTRGRIDLKREIISLQTVLGRAIEGAREQIKARDHRLSVLMATDPIWVNADVTRLEQVFANLLQNAAKYTDKGGSIMVKLEAVPSQSDGGQDALVSCKDNGMGIEPELLPRVFDLFAQGDRSLARTQGGLGIGLHIVRSLVELHGGRVEARSDGADQGSEFRVYLPIQPTAHRAEALPASEEAASHDPRRAWQVLVVDDNPDIVDSTATLLMLRGHTVRTALNGSEALEIARQFHPDLVLLDIGMPGADGYAIARRMRAQPETQHALLIAVSGYGSDEDRARAREAGFDLHFVKPLDVKLLERLDLMRAPAVLTAQDARPPLPPGPHPITPRPSP